MKRPGEDWHGPPKLKNVDMLWGGPTKAFAEQSFHDLLVPTDGIENHMKYAGEGSTTPESLHGIWWRDDSGFSTVAKDPSSNFSFVGTWEILQSFGGYDAAQYDEQSRCITVPNYGGSRAFEGNNGGAKQYSSFQKWNMTPSFCFTNAAMDTMEVFVKETQANFGPVPLPRPVANLLGYMDAGDGYVWQSAGILKTLLVKESWGWNVVTYTMTDLDLLNLMPTGYFPLLQVVDGKGARTKYYAEFLAFMNTQNNGNTTRLAAPVDQSALVA